MACVAPSTSPFFMIGFVRLGEPSGTLATKGQYERGLTGGLFRGSTGGCSETLPYKFVVLEGFSDGYVT